MPSRLASGLILVFWLATTAFVVHRDVWPRYFGDAPPAVQIDLADEATQQVPTRWKVTRAGKPVGSLTTQMTYVPADDTFRFVNKYTNLRLDAGVQGVSFDVPRLDTVIRVDRSGGLREQSLSGELVARIGPLDVGKAGVEVTGLVGGGELRARCVIKSPPESNTPVVDRQLDPVPVPAGQVLNPLMPLNRLRDVQPGRRWVIRQVNPLADAAAALVKELGKGSALVGTIPTPESRDLVAEVGRTPETLDRPDLPAVACWVITYRGSEVEARTWVSTADGRVIRQEAAGHGAGDAIRFDRQD